MSSATQPPRLPEYGADTLAAVLPSVAASLGVSADEGSAPGSLIDLPPRRRAVVTLVDGLGARLLARRGGHARDTASDDDDVETGLAHMLDIFTLVILNSL